MSDLNSKNRPDLNYPADQRLKALLQQWRGIESGANFEASVWRRIRSAAVKEQPAQPAVAVLQRCGRVPGLWAVARDWLTAEGAWAPALAAAGLALGVSLALALPQARQGPDFAAPLVNSKTLAGAYLTMASGGVR